MTKINIEGTKCFICESVIAIVNETNEGGDATLFVKVSVKHGVIESVLALVNNYLKLSVNLMIHSCSLVCYQEEIVNLSKQVNSLTSEIAWFKNQDPILSIDEVDNCTPVLLMLVNLVIVPLIHHLFKLLLK